MRSCTALLLHSAISVAELKRADGNLQLFSSGELCLRGVILRHILHSQEIADVPPHDCCCVCSEGKWWVPLAFKRANNIGERSAKQSHPSLSVPRKTERQIKKVVREDLLEYRLSLYSKENLYRGIDGFFSCEFNREN